MEEMKRVYVYISRLFNINKNFTTGKNISFTYEK